MSGDDGMSLSVSNSTRRKWKRVLPTLLCCAQVVLLSVASNAQSTSPFAKLSGTWRGGGKVMMADGTGEKIRCSATYSPESGGRSVSQALVCASDSYKVDIRSFIVADGQSVQGHWEETVRQAQGQLSGQIAGDQLEGTISGPGFQAQLSLVTTGGRQTILITPAAGGSIARVQIALSRKG
jgi:hypothetical protein